MPAGNVRTVANGGRRKTQYLGDDNGSVLLRYRRLAKIKEPPIVFLLYRSAKDKLTRI